ncbi:hypothetical protein SLA2020_060240 [Shorea laevis]
MVETGSSYSYNKQAIIEKLVAILPEIRVMVTEKALVAFLSDDILRFEAVLHRKYRDLALMSYVLNPRYVYMEVLRPLMYAFLAPLMGLLRSAMASYTVAIELEVGCSKCILGCYSQVGPDQLAVCLNLLPFLQWLLPLSQWEEHVRVAKGCIVVICRRKMKLLGEGQVEYNPTVQEVIHLPKTVYTVGHVFENTRWSVMQKLWATNNEGYPWRREWDADHRKRPWNYFDPGYGLLLKPRMWDWYMGLTVLDIAVNWRNSHVLRGFEEKYKRLLKEYPQVANILSNETPCSKIHMPTSHLDAWTR